MFVASSIEPLPGLLKLCLWGQKSPRCGCHMIVLLVEVLHPVNFVNITRVKS